MSHKRFRAAVQPAKEVGVDLGLQGKVALVAAFLASPTNTYTTGQAILVDGGMVRAL